MCGEKQEPAATNDVLGKNMHGRMQSRESKNDEGPLRGMLSRIWVGENGDGCLNHPKKYSGLRRAERLSPTQPFYSVLKVERRGIEHERWKTKNEENGETARWLDARRLCPGAGIELEYGTDVDYKNVFWRGKSGGYSQERKRHLITIPYRGLAVFTSVWCQNGNAALRFLVFQGPVKGFQSTNLVLPQLTARRARIIVPASFICFPHLVGATNSILCARISHCQDQNHTHDPSFQIHFICADHIINYLLLAPAGSRAARGPFHEHPQQTPVFAEYRASLFTERSDVHYSDNRTTCLIGTCSQSPTLLRSGPCRKTVSLEQFVKKLTPCAAMVIVNKGIPRRLVNRKARSDRQRFRTAAHIFTSTPRSTVAAAIVSHSLTLCTPDFSQPNSPSFPPADAIVGQKGH
ncbi:hypothetical protein H4582DRAFT_2132226 [Lactarius indigo]|nr:hypothetical protein H4582DRAFT_2132226 [Lactarius indigo]